MKYRDPNTGEFKELYIKASDTLPIGTIAEFTSDKVPSDWLLCDGSEISRTVYKELFAVIGTRYGEGDGSTTFNIPKKYGVVTTATTENEEYQVTYFIIKAGQGVGVTGKVLDSLDSDSIKDAASIHQVKLLKDEIITNATNIQTLDDKITSLESWKLYKTATAGDSINISNLSFKMLLIVVETMHSYGYPISTTIEIPKALLSSVYKYYDTGNLRTFARFGITTEWVSLNDFYSDNENYRTDPNTIMYVFYK